MERMWVLEASMKYPKQWLVAVNTSWEPDNKVMGDIFLVTPSKDEAYDKAMALQNGGEMGDIMVMEGYDDTPQIGSFAICSQ
ncbi:MAG: hypothetical protein LBI44_00430 [Oscillospiraceae bacterium]|jgi:uncharacterized protein YfaP (DUF2135 family)|nr:hypothetical protein [Oscillospiraceae bacterium]